MLLVRGDRLPSVCGVFESHDLSIFTHSVSGSESMWIVTLTRGHEIDHGDIDPSRERAVGGAFVAESVSRLCALVPEARERRDTDLRFSFYFGGKIDHPDDGNGRYIDACGLSNMRLAWPGVWSLSLINAREIIQSLRSSGETADIFDTAASPLALGETGLKTGARVGEELRLDSARTWHAWPEFAALHRAS